MSDYLIDNVSFKYGKTKKKILNSLNFHLKEGAINLVLGDSGSGKSTLINILSGIIPEHILGDIDGKFNHCDNNILEMSIHERISKVGIVFQDPDSSFCTYTVEDEIVFPLENLGIEKGLIKTRLGELLKIFNIEYLRDRELNRLSGGEKQKVAMASALALDPGLIIFDEPTANMDPESTVEAFSIIEKLKEKGKTILIVEHKVDSILPIIDYIHIISNKGKCVFSGTKDMGMNYLLKTTENLQIHIPESIEYSRGLKKEVDLRSKEDIVDFILNESPKFEENIQEDINSDIIIKAKNICFSYGNKSLFKNLDMEIKSGECLAIVGHNGAGKSTLLNILLDLEKKYKGKITFFGKDIKKMKKKEFWKNVGISFQNPEIQFITSTVMEEMLLSLKGEKLTEEEKNENILEYLEFFDLLKVKDNNPFLISQGEKRRLSVATVLIAGQRVLFLDEPTFGQDGRNTKKMMEQIKNLQNKGMTVIIATHDMGLLWEYCNRAIVLKKGEIIFDDIPKILFDSPNVLQAARLNTPFWFDISKELSDKLGYEVEIRNREEAYEITDL